MANQKDKKAIIISTRGDRRYRKEDIEKIIRR